MSNDLLKVVGYDESCKKEFESSLKNIDGDAFQSYGWHRGTDFSLIGALDLLKYDMVKKISDKDEGDAKGVS